MVYVALLRGINVGGKSKVSMAGLKASFESAGCEAVSTYINSGNVIFGDERPAKELFPLIEEAIFKDFGFKVPVVIRTLDNINHLCQKIPKSWTNDSEQKTDILFLWDEIDNPDITTKIVINSKLENVLYLPGALVWNIGRDNVTKGSGIKLIKSDIYRQMTARNINTVRKLHELMTAADVRK